MFARGALAEPDGIAPGAVFARGALAEPVGIAPGAVVARGSADVVIRAGEPFAGVAPLGIGDPAGGVLRGVVAVVILRTVAASNGFATPEPDPRDAAAAVSLINASIFCDWTCGVNWSPFHSSMPSASISSSWPAGDASPSGGAGGAGLVTVR
ncbi:MAG: hypothetical protein AB7P03_25440 [Kofleriaceae bacterium]